MAILLSSRELLPSAMLEAVPICNDPNFSQFATGLRSFELRRPGSTRELEIRSVNRELVSDELQSLLAEFGRGSQIFPLNFWVYEGRSLYAQFSETARAHFKLDGIKMKGAGGLVVQDDGAKKLELPKPTESFTWFNEPHLALNPDFSPYIIESKPKGLNSLTLRQALREEEAHRLLSAHGLSLRPLMAGAFTEKGAPELDLNSEPTGAVFLEASPRLKLLGQLVGFEIITSPTDFFANQFSVIGGNGNRDFCSLVMNHHVIMHKAFSTKRAAIDAVGLTRHVGHLDNFIYDPVTKKILLSDLDSVGLLSVDRSNGGEAASLVRDIASDTNRTVSGITQRAFSGALLNIYTNHASRYNPFLPVLHGYFGSDVPAPAIILACDRLHKQYLDFISVNYESLMMLHNERMTQFESKQPHGAAISGNWKYLHTSFMSTILPEVLALYRESKLAKKYPVPENVGDFTIQEHLRAAGPLLYQAVDRENQSFNLKVSISK